MRRALTSASVIAMRALASSFASWVVLATAPVAFAQGAPPAPKPPAATHAQAPDDSDSALDDDDDGTPKKTSAKAPAPPEPAPKDDEKLLPAPADPRLDEQTPTPFLRAAPRTWHDRHVELGPDVGIWSRPAKGDSVSYSPGLSWGLHARVEVFRFLGFRAYGNTTKHAVEVPRGALGLADTDVQQPDLEVFQLGARLEPTLMPLPTLRVWAGIGAGWGRATAKEPTTTGATNIDFHDRSGVYLEYSAALGATWDAIPSWLAASVSLSGGLVTDQSGDLFHEQQASNANDGSLTRVGALPEFESSFSALVGVGIIL